MNKNHPGNVGPIIISTLLGYIFTCVLTIFSRDAIVRLSLTSLPKVHFGGVYPFHYLINFRFGICFFIGFLASYILVNAACGRKKTGFKAFFLILIFAVIYAAFYYFPGVYAKMDELTYQAGSTIYRFLSAFRFLGSMSARIATSIMTNLPAAVFGLFAMIMTFAGSRREIPAASAEQQYRQMQQQQQPFEAGQSRIAQPFDAPQGSPAKTSAFRSPASSVPSEDFKSFQGNRQTTSAVSPGMASKTEQDLARFRQLVDMGIITEAEFEEKKRQMLGQ